MSNSNEKEKERGEKLQREFRERTEEEWKKDYERMLLSMFKMADSDNDGFIDKKEFRKVEKIFNHEFTEEGFEEFMKTVDFDSNGKIDLAEFIRVMNE